MFKHRTVPSTTFFLLFSTVHPNTRASQGGIILGEASAVLLLLLFNFSSKNHKTAEF